MTTKKAHLHADNEVKKQSLPIELKLPNATTRAAMQEARAMRTARCDSAKALFNDLEKIETRRKS